ncbi:SDR family oxidoreductase [Actinocrispum wychmicini]|uniref:NADP-dependent 3-hydroxy acid dehydrogenase YdfG n=1 Tax=Actinocrispum wychmicini TaxID=1213861 RepID=A0A4R2K6V3_9PSEU|nr:SDR family oxidoreductase [Actinocrispum wychmicini]TCO65669.1 NADP-dependent 3-hydroxy acid dehydrogenase YdfG [Actinocrispum wychmicini]
MTNYENLAGRTAVVTGAASGIGAATAQVLAANGAKVALLARRGGRVTELADKIKADGGQAVGVVADVTSDESVAAAVQAVHDAIGQVDLVVNNAGVMIPRSVVEDDAPAEWQRMIDTNVLGLLRVMRAFTPDLTASGHADLVNISSIGAHLTIPEYEVYTATKAAVTHLSNNLRATLGPLGVRVTNIEPGMVATELGDQITGARREFLDSFIENAGIIEAADIADLVAYATSRPARVNLRHAVMLPITQF